MGRLHFPSVEEMTAEQRDVHDEIVNGVRGKLVGPLRAVITARTWRGAGRGSASILRFSTVLPKKLNELAIIVTGRRWNSQIEFHIHSEAAKPRASMPPASKPSAWRSRGFCRRGRGGDLRVRAPAPADRHGRALALCRGQDALRRARRGRADRRDRYYTMVSMTLNVHEIPLPDGAKPPLEPPPGGGLTNLPAWQNEGSRNDRGLRVLQG